MTIYIIKWAIALTALYSLYGLFLRRETFHALNRGVLLAILGLSMVLPLCHLTANNRFSEAMQEIEQAVSGESHALGVLTTDYQQELSADLQGSTADMQGSSADVLDAVASRPAPSLWFVALVALYLVGMLYRWVRYAMGYVSLCRLIRGGECIKHDDIPGHVHLILNAKATMPCSWMRWILISPSDLRDNGAMILRHEMAHVSKRHSWDMLLCDIAVNMLWFLPFAYLLRTDLRDVHEYQADHAVMEGVASGESYQHMLIAKASTVSHAPIVNSLNASAVKKRLAMMFRKESSRLARMKVLYILPLLAIVLMSFARPDIIEQTEQVLAQEEAKVKDLMEDVVSTEKSLDTERLDRPSAGEAERAEPHTTSKKQKGKDFSLTITATVGIDKKGCNVTFCKLSGGVLVGGDTLRTVYVEFDANRQAKLNEVLTEPVVAFVTPADETGEDANLKRYLRYFIAYPGSNADIGLLNSQLRLGGTGFYREYIDAREYFFNASQYNTDEKQHDLLKQYYLDHINEPGTLFAYYDRQPISIEEIYDLTPEELLDTPIGMLIKFVGESAKRIRQEQEQRMSQPSDADTQLQVS